MTLSLTPPKARLTRILDYEGFLILFTSRPKIRRQTWSAFALFSSVISFSSRSHFENEVSLRLTSKGLPETVSYNRTPVFTLTDGLRSRSAFAALDWPCLR